MPVKLFSSDFLQWGFLLLNFLESDCFWATFLLSEFSSSQFQGILVCHAFEWQGFYFRFLAIFLSVRVSAVWFFVCIFFCTLTFCGIILYVIFLPSDFFPTDLSSKIFTGRVFNDNFFDVCLFSIGIHDVGFCAVLIFNVRISADWRVISILMSVAFLLLEVFCLFFMLKF